jgi:plastocyanin
MTVLDERSTPPPSDPGRPQLDRGDDSASGTMLFIALSAIIITLIGAMVVIGLIAMLRDNSTAETVQSTSTSVDVELSEFSIDGQLSAPAGEVVLNVFNNGAIEHNLAIRGTDYKSKDLNSRGLDIVTAQLTPGTYEVYCTIAGHEGSGMVNELIISEEGEAPAAGGAEQEAELTPTQIDQAMVDSMLAFPAATEGKGNAPLEFELMPDGTKQFELTAAVTPWEVSPGQIVEAWTYNGIVPAPEIRLDVGDKVRILVTNETELATDVHWHGIHTPNDQDGVSPYTQDPIAAGETYTYEFVVEDPGIGMYHAHMHSQISVLNGMFGAFIVGENPLPYGQTVSGVTIPAEGDLEIAVEMPMVLNDAGVIGLSLNGKSFPATEPLVLEEGSWSVVHYYNEGLTAHPMHMHQFPQLVYAKDGIPLDQPYYADTINVSPGERYSVLFQAEDPGTWVWHCHILTHVEREDGMFGMVTAVVVTPKET